MQATIPRVVGTAGTLELLARLESKYGPLMFHQSGGCCDGSAPMCFPRGEFMLGAQDVYLGNIGVTPFFMGAAQFEYWRHTQLIIDVIAGNGGMFSVEGSEGQRFITRSRLFSDEETVKLEAAGAPPRGDRFQSP